MYFLRRLLLMIPTMIGISLVVFFLVNAIPGGPVEQKIMAMKFGGAAGGGATGTGGSESGGGSKASQLDEDYIAALNKQYGFDKPVHIRYFVWMGNLIKGDFGESYYYEEPVLTVIKSRIPVSIIFGICSLFITYALCIPLGIFKAIRHLTPFDNISSGLIYAGYSVPGFALLIFLLILFGGGTWLDIFPMQGWKSDNFSELGFFAKIHDLFMHMFLPLVAYSVTQFALNTMLMKNSLIEQLNSDYVRTAYAKGLSTKDVIIKHALRNSLIPIATGFGSFLTFFLAGSFLIETIAGIDGMGLLGYESILNRDYPVALGITMIASLAVMFGNLLSDFAYVLVDPRIDFK